MEAEDAGKNSAGLAVMVEVGTGGGVYSLSWWGDGGERGKEGMRR